MKSHALCADEQHVMEYDAPSRETQNEQETLGLSPTDDIAVTASELIEMIRSGDASDVNELVQRMLNDRHAA